MKKLNFCFCLCILAFLAVGCKPDIHEKADRYVVVLSMDGFRSDYPARAHTPTLDSLARVGIKAAFRPCYPSVTFSNHYSMATGLHPDHHGLINNSFYDAELDSVFTTNCLDGRFFGGLRFGRNSTSQSLSKPVPIPSSLGYSSPKRFVLT